METQEINKRYTALAEESCCLSCGGAITYAKALLGEICVDLGSGRGTDVLRLAEQVGIEGFVYGIDISDGMLRKARRMAKNMGVNQVEFIQSELEKLPLPDQSINLVVSNCTINHVADKQQVWYEIARILKPGGRFVVSDIYSSEPVPDSYKNNPQAVAECWAGSVTKEIYLKQLDRAGFQKIEIIEESKPYPKGEIEVASFTVQGRTGNCCSCSS